MTALSNVIGFDDAPFPPEHRGAVPIVGAVYSADRLDGLMIGRVEKDGFDAADELRHLIDEGRFREHLQLIFLQGVTLAGFNVVDVYRLHERLGLPIVVVSRRQPDFERIRRALLEKISDGTSKWRILERLGPMQEVDDVFIQRVGIGMEEAAAAVRRFCFHSNLPEPLRSAHLVAGAIAEGESRGNP